jgi:hypothetical protein
VSSKVSPYTRYTPVFSASFREQSKTRLAARASSQQLLWAARNAEERKRERGREKEESEILFSWTMRKSEREERERRERE